MLMLLFIPVFYGAACAHRYLQLFAPSNLLIARVRTSPPRWRTVMLLIALAYALVGAMNFLSTAIENGAPGWLNPLVMVLAWDAIKVGLVAASVAFCCTREAFGSMRRKVGFLASPDGKGA